GSVSSLGLQQLEPASVNERFAPVKGAMDPRGREFCRAELSRPFFRRRSMNVVRLSLSSAAAKVLFPRERCSACWIKPFPMFYKKPSSPTPGAGNETLAVVGCDRTLL